MQKITFSFGKNWQDYLEEINDERIEIARKSILQFMDVESLKGYSFLDIGCGSGLFSLSAKQLEADKITSLDIDPMSVQCCNHLHKEMGGPENWQILEGSVLDSSFMDRIDNHDIVYSWGVLHHTGEMWNAIRNAARKVSSNGYFYIALYNKQHGAFGSKFWLRIKKIYNNYPLIGKLILEPSYILGSHIYSLIRFRSPVKKVRDYKKNRGMSWRRDITDWLGGYPFEVANIEEVFQFMKKEYPDFELINVKSVWNWGNNWFLFKRRS